MRIDYIAYIVGVIFLFASVVYFVKEYLLDLSNVVKLVLLILATLLSFIVADYLRRLDK